MPEIDEMTLKQQIREKRFMNSYLIYGDEPYLKQYYANLIPKKCVSPEMEGFNLRKFDAENGADINELIDSTDTLPAFSEYCCTLIKNFPLDAMYSSDKEKFEAWLREMPETTVAVFWQDTTEINPKKNAKWKSVISLFSKYGAAVRLDRMDRNALCKTVISGMKKRNCEIDKTTAFYLIDTVGDDLNILLNEVEKLSNLKSGSAVTRDDIDKISVKTLQASVFDLSKSLIRGDLSKAMSILNKLLADKEKPEMILGALAGNFVDMYRAKVSVLSGKSADYMKNFYNYKNTEFRLRNAARDCSKLSLEQIKKCIQILSDADSRLKNRVTDERIILEKLLVEIYDEI